MATKLKFNHWPKVLYLLAIFTFPLQSFAFEMGWYGTTCLSISDGETLILTDPFFTRPSFWSVLFRKTIKSDFKLVNSYLSRFKKHDHYVVLISHTHYDHILDLPSVLKIWPQATVIGPKETPFFTKKEHMRFISAKKMKAVTIGKFTFESFEALHGPLAMGFQFAHGKMKKVLPKDPDAFDYLADTSYTFAIKTKETKLLFHPADLDKKVPFGFTPDYLFVGAQGRHDTKNYYQFLKNIGAKENHTIVIPIHHDDFFSPLDEKVNLTSLFTYQELENYLKNTPLPFNKSAAPFKGIKAETL